MQQIEIEMIRAETREACLASVRHAVFSCTIGGAPWILGIHDPADQQLRGRLILPSVHRRIPTPCRSMSSLAKGLYAVLLLQKLQDVFPLRDAKNPGLMPGPRCRQETLLSVLHRLKSGLCRHQEATHLIAPQLRRGREATSRASCKTH